MLSKFLYGSTDQQVSLFPYISLPACLALSEPVVVQTATKSQRTDGNSVVPWTQVCASLSCLAIDVYVH